MKRTKKTPIESQYNEGPTWAYSHCGKGDSAGEAFTVSGMESKSRKLRHDESWTNRPAKMDRAYDQWGTQ